MGHFSVEICRLPGSALSGNQQAERWRKAVAAVSMSGGTAALLDTADSVAPGGSHMMTVDRHSRPCLEAVLAATA